MCRRSSRSRVKMDRLDEIVKDLDENSAAILMRKMLRAGLIKGEAEEYIENIYIISENGNRYKRIKARIQKTRKDGGISLSNSLGLIVPEIYDRLDLEEIIIKHMSIKSWSNKYFFNKCDLLPNCKIVLFEDYYYIDYDRRKHTRE